MPDVALLLLQLHHGSYVRFRFRVVGDDYEFNATPTLAFQRDAMYDALAQPCVLICALVCETSCPEYQTQYQKEHIATDMI